MFILKQAFILSSPIVTCARVRDELKENTLTDNNLSLNTLYTSDYIAGNADGGIVSVILKCANITAIDNLFHMRNTRPTCLGFPSALVKYLSSNAYVSKL